MQASMLSVRILLPGQRGETTYVKGRLHESERATGEDDALDCPEPSIVVKISRCLRSGAAIIVITHGRDHS